MTEVLNLKQQVDSETPIRKFLRQSQAEASFSVYCDHQVVSCSSVFPHRILWENETYKRDIKKTYDKLKSKLNRGEMTFLSITNYTIQDLKKNLSNYYKYYTPGDGVKKKMQVHNRARIEANTITVSSKWLLGSYFCKPDLSSWVLTHTFIQYFHVCKATRN